jgi:hypothetical protein
MQASDNVLMIVCQLFVVLLFACGEDEDRSGAMLRVYVLAEVPCMLVGNSPFDPRMNPLR